jgi:hypothetical protein
LLSERGAGLRDSVGGDELAQLDAMIRDAKDPGGQEVIAKRKALAHEEATKAMHEALWKKGYSEAEIADKLADPATKAALGRKAAALDAKRVAKLHTIAGDVFAGVDGVGDDPAKIYGALRKLPKGEAAYLEDLYRRRYGMELKTQLSEDMGTGEGADGQVALDLLSDDDATRLRALEGVLGWATSGTDDEALIFSTLEGLSDEERRALSPKVDELLGGDLEERELQKAKALLKTDKKQRDVEVAAADLSMAMHGFAWWDVTGIGTDNDKVLDTLQDLSATDMEQLKKVYGKHAGSDLLDDLEWEVSGYTEQVVQRELEGDKAGADASRLRVAEKNLLADLPVWAHDQVGWLDLGTDERLLERTYEKAHGRKDMSKVSARYTKETGRTQQQLLDDEFGATTEGDAERAMMGQFASKGEADEALQLLVAYQGLGTDVERTKKVGKKVSDYTPEQMAKLYADFSTYEKAYAGTDDGLLTWHHDDIGGRDGLDLSHQLQGKAQGTDDVVRRAQERYDHEVGGLGHGMMRLTESMGMHNKVTALERGKSAVVDGVLDGHALSDEQRAQWGDAFAQDHMTYGSTRDTAADTAAEGAALVATIAAIIATDGAASPFLLAALGSWNTAVTKVALRGSSNFTSEDLAKELAALGISLGTAGLGNLAQAKGLENTLVRKFTEQGMSEAQAQVAAKGLVSGLTGAPGDLANEAVGLDYDKLSDGQVAEKLFWGTARRTTTNIVSNSVGQRIDQAHGVDANNDGTLSAGSGLTRGLGQGAVNLAGDDKFQAAAADGKSKEALTIAAKGMGKDVLTNTLTDAGKRKKHDEQHVDDDKQRKPDADWDIDKVMNDLDQALTKPEDPLANRTDPEGTIALPHESVVDLFRPEPPSGPEAHAPDGHAVDAPFPAPGRASPEEGGTTWMPHESIVDLFRPEPPSGPEAHAPDGHAVDAPFRAPGRASPEEGGTTWMPHESIVDLFRPRQRTQRWPAVTSDEQTVDAPFRPPGRPVPQGDPDLRATQPLPAIAVDPLPPGDRDGAQRTRPFPVVADHEAAGTFRQRHRSGPDNDTRSFFGFAAEDDGQVMTFIKRVLLQPGKGVGADEVDRVHEQMLLGVDEIINQPKLHLDLEGFGRRQLKVEIDRVTPDQLQQMNELDRAGVHRFDVLPGHGTDTSGRFHVEGQRGSDELIQRQSRTHELMHTLFGTPDAYDGGFPGLHVPHRGLMDGPTPFGFHDRHRFPSRRVPNAGSHATQLRETDLAYIEWVWSRSMTPEGMTNGVDVDSGQLPSDLATLFDDGRRRATEEQSLPMPDAPRAHRYAIDEPGKVDLSDRDRKLLDATYEQSALEPADLGFTDTDWHRFTSFLSLGLPVHLAALEALEGE